MTFNQKKRIHRFFLSIKSGILSITFDKLNFALGFQLAKFSYF